MGVVGAVGIVHDAAAFVGFDAVLVNDPFGGGAVAEAAVEGFGGVPSTARRPLLARRIYVVMGDQRLQFDGYVKVVARVSADRSMGGIAGLRV